jgi:hypothetical protein
VTTRASSFALYTWQSLGLLSLALAVYAVISLILQADIDGSTRWLSLAGVLFFLSGVGLGSHMIIRRGRCVRLARFALFMAFVASATVSAAIAGAFDELELPAWGDVILLMVVFGATSVISLVLASIFQVQTDRREIWWLRRLAAGGLIACPSVLAFIALCAIHGAALAPYEIHILVTALLMMLSLSATPLISVLTAADKRRRRLLDSEVARASVELTCPSCRTPNTIKPGRAWCTKCACELMLEVEEPRCACGYLIFKLVGATCPECGQEIPEDLRPRQLEMTSERDGCHG